MQAARGCDEGGGGGGVVGERSGTERVSWSDRETTVSWSEATRGTYVPSRPEGAGDAGWGERAITRHVLWTMLAAHFVVMVR